MFNDLCYIVRSVPYAGYCIMLYTKHSRSAHNVTVCNIKHYPKSHQEHFVSCVYRRAVDPHTFLADPDTAA